MKMINEFVDGERIVSQFLVASSSKGTNATGSQYFNCEFKDASGAINAKKWEINPEDEKILVVGNVVQATVDCLKYKEQLQLKILDVKLVPNEEIDTTRFLKESPIPKDELIKRFNEYKDSIKDPDCKAILNYLLEKIGDKFYSHPAAVSIHHDYMSGLLMHSITMADIASKLTPIYDANYDLLITGILIHDMGKTIEMEGPAVYHYTLEGKLIGHITILADMIKQAKDELKIESEIPLLLEHMILSHHGQHDYGSPVLPSTKEALLLSLIDNLDCKLVALNKALETVNKGEFTQKIFSLDGRMFYKN